MSTGLVTAARGHNGAVIVTAPGQLDAATLLEDLLTQAHPEDETRVVYPDGVNWKVAELLEHVIEPARYAPPTRRNIVVADAHQAQPAAHDKLLKALEEPFTETTFWLCHPAAAQLPNTLRGRALAQLDLPGPTQAEALTQLASAGAVGPRARHLLDLAQGDVQLACAAAKFDLDTVLEVYRSPATTPAPHLVAGRVVLAAAHLAVALGHKTAKAPASPRGKGAHDTADLSRLRPEQRARLRRLIARLLDTWERELLVQVAQVETASGMRALEAGLAGIRAARTGSVYNTPVPTVVTRALVTMPR